tara:strand:+ start:197 stop:826 length:630 start_codon:yes stop_codon:yes gene_type:complete
MIKKSIGITILGDSIIRYQKNNISYDWSKELKNKILKKLGNDIFFKIKSIHGINSSNLLKVIPSFFTQIKKKDILIIQIGINDSWHYKSLKGLPCISIDIFKKNLSKIYNQCKAYKFKKLVFVNYHKLLNNRIEVNKKSTNQNLKKYNKEIFLFCKKNNLDLIDIDKLTKNKNLCLSLPDGVHLNKTGVSTYSSIIFKFLIKTIYEKKI